MIPQLWKEGFHVDVSFRDEYNSVSYSLYIDRLCVSVSIFNNFKKENIL